MVLSNLLIWSIIIFIVLIFVFKLKEKSTMELSIISLTLIIAGATVMFIADTAQIMYTIITALSVYLTITGILLTFYSLIKKGADKWFINKMTPMSSYLD